MIHDLPIGGPHWEPGLVQNGRLVRLHKGGGYQPSSQDKKNAALQERLLRAQLKQLKDYQAPEMPEIPPVEVPSPSPGQTPTDVAQAEADARKQAARRKGLRATIFGGASAGVQTPPGGTLGGGRSYLG